MTLRCIRISLYFTMPMSGKDKALTRLYMAATFHHWDILPGDIGTEEVAESALASFEFSSSFLLCRARPQVLRRRLHLSGSQSMCEAPHCVRPFSDRTLKTIYCTYLALRKNNKTHPASPIAEMSCLLEEAAAHRVAGYGPCLAATNHLHAAKVMLVTMHFTW